MANVTPIRAVKSAFSTHLALTAALQMSRGEQTKMTVALVAALAMRTDDRGVVRVRYDELAAALNVARRTVEIRFPALLAAGALERPDPRTPWEYRWNVERLTELSAQDARAANDCPVSEPAARSGTSPILAAFRDGYRREHAKQTERDGLAVAYAPPFPRAADRCVDLIRMAESFAAEVGADECEAARYLAIAYRRFDAGAEQSRWSWEWLLRSTVAKVEAASMIARNRMKHRPRRSSSSPAPKHVDSAATAAAAAEIARAVGGAR